MPDTKQHSFDFDTVGFITDYESGTLDEDTIIKGFQQLINQGIVWQLQGHYGRTAMYLISNGYCKKSLR